MISLLNCLFEDVLDVELKKIERNDASDFLLKKHYLKQFPTSTYLYIGIYVKNNLVGVVAYGTPMSEKWFIDKFTIQSDSEIGTAMEVNPTNKHLLSKGDVSELKRLYIDDIGIKNIESYVISRSNKILKQERPQTKIIVTYADQIVNHRGVIYQATNAIYLGISKDGKHKYIYPVGSPIQNKLIKLSIRINGLESQYPKTEK